METTKGKWYAVEYAGFVSIQDVESYEYAASHNILTFDCVGKKEALANGLLIADAGNTYQQCNLLPSELLSQRDELLRVLKELSGCVSIFSGANYTTEFIKDANQKAKSLIKKVTEHGK